VPKEELCKMSRWLDKRMYWDDKSERSLDRWRESV